MNPINPLYVTRSVTPFETRLYFDSLAVDRGVRVYENPVVRCFMRLFNRVELITMDNHILYCNRNSLVKYFREKKIEGPTFQEKADYIYRQIISKLGRLYKQATLPGLQKKEAQPNGSHDKAIVVAQPENDTNDGDFASISDEILLEIISYLGIKEINHLGRTCRRFYHFTTNETVWKRLYKIAFPLANDALSHSVQSWKAKYKHFIDLCKNPPYVKQLTEVAYYKRTEGGFLMMRKLEDHKLFKSSYLIQGIDSRTHGEVEKVQRWDELNIFYLSMREGSDQNQSLNGSSDRGQLRKAIQTLNIESEDLKDFRGCMDATVLAIKPSDSSKIAIWDRTTKQRMGEIVLENLLEPSRFELSEGLLMGYSSDFIYDF